MRVKNPELKHYRYAPQRSKTKCLRSKRSAEESPLNATIPTYQYQIDRQRYHTNSTHAKYRAENIFSLFLIYRKFRFICLFYFMYYNICLSFHSRFCLVMINNIQQYHKPAPMHSYMYF